MEKQREELQEDAEKRREFLKKAGSAAITAPAVALLLSIDSDSAFATTLYVGPS